MNLLILIFLQFLFSILINSKVLLVPDTQIQECYEYKYEKANFLDYSKIEFIPYNDTDVFLNGKIIFARDVAAPWRGNAYTEQYIQGQWIFQAFNRTYDDLCFAMKNPAEPFYLGFVNRTKCPYKKGTTWEYDMQPVKIPQEILDRLPPHYMGRWRLTTRFFKHEKGVMKEDCVRVFADIYEV